MHTYRNRRNYRDTHRSRMGISAVGVALLIVLNGCATEPQGEIPTTSNPTTVSESGRDTDSDDTIQPDSQLSSEAEANDTTIPDGAYAASDEFPFPIPDGWEILEPFVEGKLGKDVSVDASIEYPGDAKEAAATYQVLLKEAGFDAYTYVPGELTNQASLVAEGHINDIAYTTILNFDVHADGLQRVSITAVEDG